MFYTFNQNNSGGSFDYTPRDGISHYVIVEGDDIEEAVYRAKRIGLYFDGVANDMDCGCCGDRWYEPWRDDADAEPMVYDEPVANFKGGQFGMKWIDGPEGYVHYKDGRVEGFWDSDETA
jgi:hypothetical protein